MHEKMMSFLNENSLLYMKQFVFRKNYSTTHAIVSLIKNIEKAIGNKQLMCSVKSVFLNSWNGLKYEFLGKNTTRKLLYLYEILTCIVMLIFAAFSCEYLFQC